MICSKCSSDVIALMCVALARHACNFGIFFSHEDGTTPHHLLKAGVYNEIAVPLKGGVWRQTSLAMLARHLLPGAEEELKKVGFYSSRITDYSARINRLMATGKASSQSSTRVESFTKDKTSRPTNLAKRMLGRFTSSRDTSQAKPVEPTGDAAGLHAPPSELHTPAGKCAISTSAEAPPYALNIEEGGGASKAPLPVGKSSSRQSASSSDGNESLEEGSEKGATVGVWVD